MKQRFLKKENSGFTMIQERLESLITRKKKSLRFDMTENYSLVNRLSGGIVKFPCVSEA